MVDYGGPSIRERALNGQSDPLAEVDAWIARLGVEPDGQEDPLAEVDAWITRLETEQQQKAPGAAPAPTPRPLPGAAPSVAEGGLPRDDFLTPDAHRPTEMGSAEQTLGRWTAERRAEHARTKPPYEPPPINAEAMEAINAIRKPAIEKARKEEETAGFLEARRVGRMEEGVPLGASAEEVAAFRRATAKPGPEGYPKPVGTTEATFSRIPEGQERYKDPGAWARFSQPWKDAAKMPQNLAAKIILIDPMVQEAIELEAGFRELRGLYDPDEAPGRAGAGNLRRSIGRELELGLPMYHEEAARLQETAYELMAEFGPKHFPRAQGFWNTLASSAGDITVLITELALMRKAGLNKLAKAAAPGAPAVAAAGGMGAGFGLSALARGEDFKEAAVSGALLSSVGSVGRAAAGPLGAGGAVSAYMMEETARKGGTAWEVVIQGILVPLAFHGREMSREVPRLLQKAPAAADKILGRAVEAVQAGRDAGAEVRRLVRGLTDGTLSLSKEGRAVWRDLRRPATEEQRLAVEAGERTQPQREPSVFEPAVEARGEEAMREAGVTPVTPKEPSVTPKKPLLTPKELPVTPKEPPDALRIRPGKEADEGIEGAVRPLPPGRGREGVQGGEGEPTAEEILTKIPKEWRGRILYDWGSKGLRAQGNDYVKVAGERPRKTFDDLWLRDLDRIDVPNPKLLRAVKKLTEEVWPVRRRRGKFWSTSYYLAPRAMIERARSQIGEPAEPAEPLQVPAAKEVKGAEKEEELFPFGKNAAEAFDRKHKLIEATGFTPPRSAEAMGAVANPAETETLYDVLGKITSYVKGSPERVKERELAKRIFRQRRGRVGLAAVDVHEMGKEFNRLEKEVAAPEEFYNIHQAMVGKHPIDDLPEGQANWVRKARALHDKASLDLLGELLKDQGETTLTESIRQNMGTYLAETLTPKGPIERIKALVSRRHKLRGEQFKFKRDKWAVEVGRSHFKFETRAEAKEAHDALLRNELTAVIKKKALERGVTAEDLKKAAAAKKVKLIAPLTEEQRLEMGFSRNPMFTWATSYVKTRHNVETLRVFRLLDKRFAQDAPTDVAIGGDKTIADWAKENGFERVKGDKNVVGVLADRYLPKHIAKDVNELTKVPGLVERWYGAYLQAWKSSKTIWNPPTHMRNIFGNFMFADLADVAIHDPRNWKYYKAAMADLIVKGSDYRLLVREGVIGGEYYGNEVKQILVRMEKGDAPDLALIKLGQLLHEKLGRLYNAEDQIFKLAAYLKYRSKGMAPKAAAREVNRWFPNYAELHPWTKKVSRSPWGGPFLAFNEQAIRIAGRAAIRHPLKLAKWAAIPGAMTAFSTYYLGIGEDEKDLVDSRRSSFEPLLPVRDKDGAVQKLDLRYIIPMANELQKIIDYATGKSGRIEVPFLLQNPPISGWNDVVYNKSLFTGRQIVSPEDSLKTKLVKHIGHMLWESTPIPTSFTWGRQRLQRAFSDKSDEHVVTAIAGALFGVNIRDPYVSRQDKYERLRALAEKDPAVARVMNRLLNGRIKSISYSQLIRSLNRNDRYQDLLDLVNQAYRRSGGKEITTKGVLQSIRHKTSKEAEKKKGRPISMAKPRQNFTPLPTNLSFEKLARTG